MNKTEIILIAILGAVTVYYHLEYVLNVFGGQ